MSDTGAHPRPIRGLSEETITREGAPDEENPFWQNEEIEPHPNPELGCIQRGHCCRSSPGWFGPGEVERAAEYLGMTPDAFVRRYVVIDELEVDGEAVAVFAPVKIGRDHQPVIPAATRVDALYRAIPGPCVFFRSGGCRIYPVRPIECRHYLCTREPDENLSHEAIARRWRTNGG